MTAPVGKSVALRARELTEEGQAALAGIPSLEQLARKSAARRHSILDELRLELYAVCSVIADATVHRALRERSNHPPYGLVRSMHSESRMVLESPPPVPEGSIDGFYALGKAYVDTTVFHLHRQRHDHRQAGQGWLWERVEELLKRFRPTAGPSVQARMRDGVSFIYGGLHFGTGVCVQLAEVMSRLLIGSGALDPGEKAVILKRSVRPALRMAALNVDQVVGAYQHLQAGTGGWMDARRFVVQPGEDGRPWRIELGDDELGSLPAPAAPAYATLGCPARTSATGGTAPIAGLWDWCVDLALETGLIDQSRPAAAEG